MKKIEVTSAAPIQNMPPETQVAETPMPAAAEAEIAVTEPVETEVPEGEAPMMEQGPMEKMAAIIKKYYPDADTETPEGLITAALPFVEKLDVFQTWLNESIENEVDPTAAMGMLSDIKNGKSWGAAILSNFDPEELAMDEGAQAPVEQRKAKAQERNAKIKKWNANEIESANAFIQAADEIELPEPQREEVAQRAGVFLKDAADRLITVDNWKVFMNGARHEQVVSEKEKEKEMAYEDGIVAGKNMKIEKKRISPDKGDGLPQLTTSGVSVDVPSKKKPVVAMKKEFRV